MRTEPIPFISSAYKDQVRAWSSQDICNWIPSAAEMPGATTQQRAVTAPGLKPYAEFGSGQVRGIYNCNENIFVVVGSQLFQISNTGVAIPRGIIPGVQRVRFAHNQITGGSELVIVNGYSGYIYNTVTLSLSKISDESFPGSLDVVFIDNYFVHIEPQRRFAFSSGLANGNSYSDLDRFTSEVKPDLLVGMIETNNELLLFSEKSAEFFENTGAANQPFRSKRIYMNRGCAGRDTINLTDNTVFWLGDDGCFYRLDSYSPIRISTRPIEEAIRGLNWSQAFSFVWNDSGHSVVYWTFPDGLTFGYDAATRMWHRRSSNGLSRWRVNCMATWNDKWLAGDFQTGRIWLVDWDYHYEGDQEIEREMTAPVIRDNQNRVIMPRLEVIMDVGNEQTAIEQFPAQPASPSISGDAPDTFIGADYSYTYFASSGTPPLRFSLIGSLPDGLVFNEANGGISGTPTAADQSSFTVRVTDKNGLLAEIQDSITVGVAIWLLRISGAGDNRVWVSGDGLDWAGPYTRAPFVVPAGKASRQLDDGSVIVVGTSALGELATDTIVNDGVITESIVAPAGVGRIRTIDNIIIGFYGTNNSSANNYWLITDGGRAWEAVALPGGRRVRDIGRAPDGRWWSYQEIGPTYGMYYSDEEVPRNWTSSGYSVTADGEYVMASGAGYLMMQATSKRLMRLNSGSWQTLTPSSPVIWPDARSSIYSDGRWIFSGQPRSGNINLIYTDDNGVSVSGVSVPGIGAIENIYKANGKLIASGQSIIGISGRATVCVSGDNGSTWTPSNHPYAVESGGSAVAFPVK